MTGRSSIRTLPLADPGPAPAVVTPTDSDPDQRRRELAAAFADELATLRTAATEQGRIEGERQALDATRRREQELDSVVEQRIHAATLRLDEARAALLRAAEALREHRASQLRELEADCIEVAYDAVLRLIGERAAAGTLLTDLVRTALEQLGTQRVQRIRLARADLAQLAPDALTAGLELVADDALAPGDCVIETNRGALDASLERQLAGLRAALLATQRPLDAGA